MKSILPMAGILAASIAAAPAASITVNAVGTFNGNARTVLEATGNSLDVATCASNVATAFANDTGGVWDFDGAAFGVIPGETITLNYGTSPGNSLVLTYSSAGGGFGIDQGANPGEATSGSTLMGLQGDPATRVFTPNKPLLTVGIFNTDRNDAGRVPMLTVTYQDTSTASTSGANADNVHFHGLTGTLANPIVSFSISQNNFVRYDDLAFVVAPETDSEPDGLLDSWEVQYFGDIDATNGGPTEDWDADGMTDKEEHDNGTHPKNSDTDGDGLADGEEFHGFSNAFSPNTPTSPALADSDNDGVNDSDENGWINLEFDFVPTNPNAPDTDGDGMSDGYELANNTPGTALDPNDNGSTDATQAPNADRDADGLSNLAEFDPIQGPNTASPQTRADLADTDSDGLSDLVEDNTNSWSSITATGTDPTDPDSDDDGLLDGQENYDLVSYPGPGLFPTNSDPNLADTDGDGYNDMFEANNDFDPNDSEDTPVRAAVGAINPDAGTNGLTVVDSPANAGDANFLALSSMANLMATEFAANNGGVINWDASSGWTGTATEFSAAYGADQLGMLTITMAPPVDGGAPTTFGQGSGGGSTPTSGSSYLAFSGGSGAGTPVTFNFSKGLSAWGITQLARPGDRTVTMSYTLADASVIDYAPDTVTDSSSTLNWYGVQVSASNPIMSVTITSDGLVRYDDMAFVVSGSAGSYTSWAGANAPGQTMGEDHDGDGVDNGIEYFMGETGSAFTANPSAVSGSVTWPMGDTYSGVYGTDYEVQFSTNLVNWTKVDEGTGDNTVTVTAGTSVAYDIPTGGSSFVRLVVRN